MPQVEPSYPAGFALFDRSRSSSIALRYWNTRVACVHSRSTIEARLSAGLRFDPQDKPEAAKTVGSPQSARVGRTVTTIGKGECHLLLTKRLLREPQTDIRRLSRALQEVGATMLKILGWIVGIIFLIGLLVVIGVFDLIF
ncbi:MAG TPA: hypothetical protein VIL28_08760 [Steroidobacteraceae bacterium]